MSRAGTLLRRRMSRSCSLIVSLSAWVLIRPILIALLTSHRDLFPLKLTFLTWRPWHSDDDLTDLLRRFDSSSLGVMNPIQLVKRAIPESVPIKVTEIVPRLKDGGAFVKFSHPNEISPAEIEGTLMRLLAKEPIKPWFNPFRGIKAGLVKGVPWLEDLYVSCRATTAYSVGS